MNKSPVPRGKAAGFSLIEILSVLAVVATLAVLTLPGISHTLGGLKITGATQIVVEELQNARASALAQNLPVEVWFLRENGRFQAVRSLLLNADGTSTWISRSRHLPEGIAFAAQNDFSNIIGSQTLEAAPNSPAGTEGVRLRIHPSGTLELVTATSLGSNDPHFLTITPLADFDPDQGTELPPNFATVQINPLNARVTTHRP